jgi:hypothetical protein
MRCADPDRHERLLLGCLHQGGVRVLVTFTDGCTGQVCQDCDRTLGMKRQPDLAERVAGPAGGLELLVLLRAVNRGSDHGVAP